MATKNHEFYIGWQAEAPGGIAHKIRQFIFAIGILVPVVGALLVLHQSGFATSTFELGQPTELEGVLVKTPAPFLQVFRGKDPAGKPVFQNILLVAPGKHGATEMLLALEQKLAHPLDGRMVKMRGFLIYHDGKSLMEVEEMTGVTEQGVARVEPPPPVHLGNGALFGEITDPKCLFGVMKPGYGKPHRSCAARCIAGGIPPVLKSVSSDGSVQYYLLAGAHGEPVNSEVLPFVGDQVMVCGSIYRMGDWLVLYKGERKHFALAPAGLANDNPVCR